MFGIKIFDFKKSDKFKEKQIDSPIKQDEPESNLFDPDTISFGLNFDEKIKSIEDQIITYRNVSKHYEVEDAIDNVVNEAIVLDEQSVVNINLDEITDLSKNIKDKIKTEFDNILQLLDFNKNSDDQFRRWYIDGRLYVFVILDNKIENGINKLIVVSPLDIVRIKNKKDGKYWFVYKPNNTESTDLEYGYRLPEELVTFVPSGISDSRNKHYISYLHRVIKPLNQLQLLEDSAVIYRITRAPERRVFYIDVGKLPKKKAEEYVKKLMNRFKNKVSYDVNTGKVTQKKEVLSMLEDFYLPTSGDSKGTKVEVLDGGRQLGEITDLLYFKKKLYKSLKVPLSRIDQDDSPTISFGQDSEITREELKFNKFINKLRQRFSFLFIDLLKKQLIYKNILDLEEWEEIKNRIKFVWAKDNFWSQRKENEILSSKLDLLSEISDYIGTYYSHNYVRKNILKQSDEEIKAISLEIEDEKKAGKMDEE